MEHESPVDAILILDALHQIAKLGIAPDGLEFDRDTVERLPDIGKSVQQAAGISDDQLAAAHAYGGGEWYRAFLQILYGNRTALRILAQ
jgi:hypothetical protein